MYDKTGTVYGTKLKKIISALLTLVVLATSLHSTAFAASSDAVLLPGWKDRVQAGAARMLNDSLVKSKLLTYPYVAFFTSLSLTTEADPAFTVPYKLVMILSQTPEIQNGDYIFIWKQDMPSFRKPSGQDDRALVSADTNGGILMAGQNSGTYIHYYLPELSSATYRQFDDIYSSADEAGWGLLNEPPSFTASFNKSTSKITISR
jgi:hypothetical protein